MRAFVPVVDVLPAIKAVQATVRATEQPVSDAKRIRFHLRLAPAAARYPFGRRLMLGHFHVGARQPDQIGMEGAQIGFRIGGEIATLDEARHGELF